MSKGSSRTFQCLTNEWHDALSRQQAGLPGLFAQAAVLPNAPARKVLRSIHEGARDVARDIAKTDAYVTSRRERKKVEMLFAHLKRILKLDRLRLRGPNGARDEFHLAATAQNLRKLAMLSPAPAPTSAT
jgi:Transposase DDE domain